MHSPTSSSGGSPISTTKSARPAARTPTWSRAIEDRLKPLQELVSGYDFAAVIGRYLQGFQTHDEHAMAAALRWLRAEYRTKTEARQDLGVRSIIDDAQFYDYLKLFAAFVRLAGFAGLLVNIDEMGVLSHRLNNSQARNANYEAILRIVNDCLQGNVAGIGFLFGGTDTFLEDRRRGWPATRLWPPAWPTTPSPGTGLKDFSGPVIRAPEPLARRPLRPAAQYPQCLRARRPGEIPDR